MTDNIIYDQHYQGIPLAIEHGPFLEKRLADALVTIENIMQTIVASLSDRKSFV